jgi:hypothetical protein
LAVAVEEAQAVLLDLLAVRAVVLLIFSHLAVDQVELQQAVKVMLVEVLQVLVQVHSVLQVAVEQPLWVVMVLLLAAAQVVTALQLIQVLVQLQTQVKM